KPAGHLKDGEFGVDKLQPGSHRVKIASPDGEASLSFQIGVAAMPALNGEIASRDAAAVVVTSLGSSARAACSRCEGGLMLDGKAVDGKPVATGAHELVFTAGGQTQRTSFRNAEAPAIAIHLSSTANPAGTLVVETNVDGASVSIDRRRLDR